MAVVDHERVLLDLKAYVIGKRSFGQRELLETIARLETENEIPETEEGFDARPPRPRPADELPPEGRTPVMASH